MKPDYGQNGNSIFFIKLYKEWRKENEDPRLKTKQKTLEISFNYYDFSKSYGIPSLLLGELEFSIEIPRS